ncbi:hypothetical protein [Cerasicoccus frondis]|uniref:hypothetical protein n=1 Tax=Cerasicoccus frondis TaxID=490090 RepID=UPI002852A108|nr:hypothetical protein [Cerasicoccus frondis]
MIIVAYKTDGRQYMERHRFFSKESARQAELTDLDLFDFHPEDERTKWDEAYDEFKKSANKTAQKGDQ